METLKINRELISIWVLGMVSIVSVIVTHNRLLMLPLFAYIIYKSIRGIITHRRNLVYLVPFSFLLMMSSFAIYAIALKSLPQ